MIAGNHVETCIEGVEFHARTRRIRTGSRILETVWNTTRTRYKEKGWTDFFEANEHAKELSEMEGIEDVDLHRDGVVFWEISYVHVEYAVRSQTNA